MLKHERTESIKRIASQMVALPVAQTRNTVVRGAKTKKFENNLYQALKAHDTDSEIDRRNDYIKLKSNGPDEKRKTSYIEMQTFKM